MHRIWLCTTHDMETFVAMGARLQLTIHFCTSQTSIFAVAQLTSRLLRATLPMVSSWDYVILLPTKLEREDERECYGFIASLDL